MVDFLVIGPISAITYRDIFPLIKDGNVSFGWNNVVEFEDRVKFGNIRWFSNISDYYPPKLELKKYYNEIDYDRFDNYDCINIDRISDIPSDYDGLMGVPITFIEKWNPGQFDILDIMTDYRLNIDGKSRFPRILIKKKIL